MIDRCFSCRRVPILMPANIAHTTWQCICDCGMASHSARNKKGAVDNWNTLQRLLEWNRNNEVKKVA